MIISLRPEIGLLWLLIHHDQVHWVHPYYGEIKVCVDGEVLVSHSGREAECVALALARVEAVEISFPTASIATDQTLISPCSDLNDRIGETFAHVGLKGLPILLVPYPETW